MTICMRALPAFWFLALLGGVHSLTASAAESATESAAESAKGTQAADPCIAVEVNGQRSRSFDCLTQKLQPAASPQTAGQANMTEASEEIAHRPSNQIGLFNYSATSHRMGNNFGVSVFPQRPPPSPAPAAFPHLTTP